MKLHQQSEACDPQRLESFLRCNLSAAAETEFASHLNCCERCRAALEEQAADRAAWREAEELLRPVELDSPGDDDFGDPLWPERQSRRRPHLIQSVLSALGPTDDPAMLGRLAGYEVSGVIGAGGMGVVLKAIDEPLDRTVAIKVLAPHLAASGAARKRFAREAKAAAAVLHPNVIAIHGVSNDDALPYLVMPYVRGASLQKRLDNEGPLPLPEILRIGAQIAAGLAAAHAQGLVHRDIKPANILLEEGVERVAITDFGLARAVDDATLTTSGVIAGTPQYMSPEQARGETVDQRSDLFSLGSVLYAACTGRPPFRAETSHGVLRRITDVEPTPIRDVNPDIPNWLATIISRLMAKRAESRYGSAAEVAELLENCLAHVQQPAKVALPKGLPRPVRRTAWSPSHLTVAGVVAMVAVAGIALFGLALLTAEPPDISGQWTGNEWGQVVLKKMPKDHYTGTYTDTFGAEPGKIALKWSRIERRFNGTWREGKDRFGKLSVRLVGDEIRGAHTTDRDSKISPGIPRLADLAWRRAAIAAEPPPAAATALEGDWRLESITGGQVISFEQDLVARVRGDQWTIVRENSEVPHRLVFNVEGNRQAIDLIAKRDSLPPLTYRGLYYLRGDTLTIAWGPRPSVRPADFDGVDGGVHQWKRIKADDTSSNPAAANSTSLPRSVLQGIVTGLQDQELVEISLGLDDGLRVKDVLDVHRDNTYLGRISIVRVAKDQSVGRIEVRQGEIRVGDHVGVLAVQQDAAERPGSMKPLDFPGPAIAVACSADGKLLAVAHEEPDKDSRPAVDVFNPETGERVASLKLSTEEENAVLKATEHVSRFRVTAMEFAPVGDALAVGTDIGQVKLFNARTGELVRALDHKEPRLADKETPENWQPVVRALGSVRSLAFSQGGSLLAVCGESFAEFADVFDGVESLGLPVTGPGRLKIFDVKSGALKHDLPGHSQAFAIAFSADSSLLASAGRWTGGGSHGNGVLVWDPESGTKTLTIDQQTNGGTHAIAFAPARKLALFASLEFDKENDTRSTALSLMFPLSGIMEWQRSFPGWAHPMGFSPDGNAALVLVGGKSIHSIDVSTGATQREISLGESFAKGRTTGTAIVPPGKRIAIAGVTGDGTGRVAIIDLQANSGEGPKRD
jgi:uncharacterized protein (TIGR03067 family)